MAKQKDKYNMNIELKNVTKKYDDEVVLDDISLSLNYVEAVSIIGMSGCGKSTLLRLLSGIETFDSGDMSIDDMDIYSRAYKDKIGFVFQAPSLFPHLTMQDNIVLILEKVKKIDKEEAIRKTENLLKQFGLYEHKDKYPHMLSGGQQQRACIVRSLAVDADIFFFDEPTSALDPILTAEVLDLVKKLRDMGKKFVVVTHHIGFARTASDYVLYMHEGKILEHGRPDILDNPKSHELKEFLSKVLKW